MDFETLQKFIKSIQTPCLYIAELAAFTGMSEASIRMNIKRGNIALEHTPQAGRGQGVRALYPFCDLIEVMALAELSRAGLPFKRTGYGPKSGSGIAFVVSNMVLRCLLATAEPKKYEDNAKFAIIFYSADYEGIEVQASKEPIPDFTDRPEIAWIIIDCRALALKAFEFFKKNQGILAR